MCIIAYKPENVSFPTKSILENCFNNNSDGAGFMYAYGGKVYIRKGFETFKAFYNALENARKITGNNVPYVMHFRIATQGYKMNFTHPFPLSSKMENLNKLKLNCNIGVAHNGIINLTSDGSANYSDTMKFITDYLSLIIQSYDYYKNDRLKKLIEKLISASRLAILDKNGHCELLGSGWVENKGVYYSNNTYSYKKGYWNNYYWPATMYGSNIKKNSVWNKYDEYAKHYNRKTKQYDFDVKSCPVVCDSDYTYCYCCKNRSKCNNVDYNYGFDYY